MAKNRLTDLNDHLFAQLERLGDETMKPEQMELEIRKSKAMVPVSEQIIKNAKLVLEAAKMQADGDVKHVPEQFGMIKIDKP